MKTGVEMEFWTVDDEGKLISCEKIANDLDFSEPEFVKPLFEIKTSPCESIEEIRTEIKENLKKAIEEFNTQNKKLVPLGTPLNSGKIEKISSPRSEIQEKVVGTNLEYAKQVAGLHFHFEQDNPINQMKNLAALDPASCLVNSSPYINGEPLASSSRNLAYRYKCYSQFPNHAQLWNYSRLENWEEESMQRFNEFKEKAKRRGIPDELFEENFKPEDTLWTPIRLRKKFNTVEWRAPDTTIPSESIKLLDKVRNIIESNSFEKPKFDRLKKISENAICDGIKSKSVRDYLEGLGIEHSDFNPQSEEITRKERISRLEARKIRLKHAKKLENDLKNL